MANTGETTRSTLLQLLRDAGGEWVSGEAMSEALGVSRAAVSKHLRVLREQGHAIEAVTRKGYRLVQEADLLDADTVRDGLQTKIFGRVDFVHLASTASTNMEAMALAVRGAPEGTIVVADEQTGGRGRKGRVWESPAGTGLYVSLVLRPDIAPEAAPVITLLTNVVVAEAIHAVTGITPVCKWPNDVLIDERKVSGNLTEAFLVADNVGHVVTGAGINILTKTEELPDDVREKATSLAIATGRSDLSRREVLQAYLQRYEHWYAKFQQEGVAPIMQRWKELTNVLGKELRVEVRGEVLTGEVLDVDSDGFLLLRDADGKTHRLFSGDILE